MRKRNKTDRVIIIAIALLSIWVLIVVAMQSGPNRAIACRHWATACQALARMFGSWGMNAERAYYRIMELERTI